MTSKNDLGIAILKHLIDKGGQVGYVFNITDFLATYIKKTNDASKLNTWIAREIIDDLFKMGYVNTMEKFGEIGIYNYGRPEDEQKEPKNAGVALGITWKGKAFYYEHINKGKFDKQETVGLIIIIVLTLIGTITTVIQTTYTIQDHCQSHKSTTDTIETNQSSKPYTIVQKNECASSHKSSNRDSSQQFPHTPKTDTAFGKQK